MHASGFASEYDVVLGRTHGSLCIAEDRRGRAKGRLILQIYSSLSNCASKVSSKCATQSIV
jgi:hypothetical protein